MKFLVLDLQFYPSLHSGVKELCVYDGEKLGHFVFLPEMNFSTLPENCKKQVRWLQHNHLCIPYDSGYVSTMEISNILVNLTEGTDRIYVKGQIKEDFLKQHLSNIEIINMENMWDCPNIEKGAPSCIFHSSSSCFCSITIAKQMFQFILSKMS